MAVARGARATATTPARAMARAARRAARDRDARGGVGTTREASARRDAREGGIARAIQADHGVRAESGDSNDDARRAASARRALERVRGVRDGLLEIAGGGRVERDGDVREESGVDGRTRDRSRVGRTRRRGGGAERDDAAEGAVFGARVRGVRAGAPV